MSGAEMVRAVATLLRADPARAGPLIARMPDEAWGPLFACAGEHLVTPEIAAALADAGLTARLPPDVIAYLDEIAALNAERNRRIRAQVAEVAALTAARGITPMLLKGAAILVGGSRPARMMRDIDLLVAESEVAAVDAALVAVGYTATEATPAPWHAVAYYMRPGEPAMIDLHVAAVEPPVSLPVAPLRARACTIELDGAPIHIPCAAHAALLAAVHDSIGHQTYLHADPSLRPVHDVWRAAAPLSADDWAEIGRLVALRGLHGPVGGLLRLASAWFDWRAPAAARAAGIESLGARVFAQRVAWRLDRPDPGWADRAIRRAVRRLSNQHRRPDGPALGWRMRELAAGVLSAPAWLWRTARRPGQDDV